MKRLLICLLLLCTCLAPSRALAWLFPPFYVVFTFTADPLDPLGGTSTGWHFLDHDDAAWQHPMSDEGDIDFWWQAHHWTAENTLSETSRGAEIDRYNWSISGGPEGDFINSNGLDRDFDIEIKGGTILPAFGVTYSASMAYLNPTVSLFGRTTEYGLSYYLASGSWYITDQQPPAASPPGIPEPSSLALLVIGLGAMVASRRKSR